MQLREDAVKQFTGCHGLSRWAIVKHEDNAGAAAWYLRVVVYLAMAVGIIVC